MYFFSSRDDTPVPELSGARGTREVSTASRLFAGIFISLCLVTVGYAIEMIMDAAPSQVVTK